MVTAISYICKGELTSEKVKDFFILSKSPSKKDEKQIKKLGQSFVISLDN